MQNKRHGLKVKAPGFPGGSQTGEQNFCAFAVDFSRSAGGRRGRFRPKRKAGIPTAEKWSQRCNNTAGAYLTGGSI